MSRRTEVRDVLTEVLNEVANRLARETGFLKRERNGDGVDCAPGLICGRVAEPEITLEGVCQRGLERWS